MAGADGASTPRMRVLLSWSSGKDSAWALHVLRAQGHDVRGLLTTVAETTGRVAAHGVRGELLAAQAEALALPLAAVPLPDPCPNDVWTARVRAALAAAARTGVQAVAFGDLHLADVRAFRERVVAGTGLRPMFPLWESDTRRLARTMIAAGVRARVVAVDTDALGVEALGASWEREWIEGLPPDVDPCGENGEFHTFVTDAPGFRRSIAVRTGSTRVAGRQHVIDLLPQAPGAAR